MADLQIMDTDPNPTASVQFLDADGNPTVPDDVPQWASSDTSIAAVTASDDGLSATIAQTGTLGACVVSVTSVRSSDGTTVGGQATLTVVASEETQASVTLSPGVAAAAPTEPAAPADPGPTTDAPPTDDSGAGAAVPPVDPNAGAGASVPDMSDASGGGATGDAPAPNTTTTQAPDA